MSKKLVWFRSELLSWHTTSQDDLPWYDWILDERKLPEIARSSSLDWHIAMRRALNWRSVMIDGTRLSQRYGDGMRLSRLPANNGKLIFDIENGRYVDRNFTDMVDSRMHEIMDHAKNIGVERICLSYSGGSDSALLVSAALRNNEALKWISSGRLEILATRMSQREDPMMWDRIKRTGIKIRVLNYDQLMREDDWMLVTGEGEPYGTFFLEETSMVISKEGPLLKPWKDLQGLFTRREPSGLAWEYFQNLMAIAPFTVNTMHQACWWLEACIDRQDDPLRYNAFTGLDHIRTDCIGHGQRCFSFLAGQEFLDHAAFVILEKMVSDRDHIKIKSDEYTSRWMGYDEIKIKPKFYSQDRVPRHVHKLRIFDDWSWDNVPNLHGFI